MRHSKSPAKQAIYWALDACEEQLQRWQIVREERMAQAQDLIAQEWEAREQIRRLRDEIADHFEVLHDLERTERLERKEVFPGSGKVARSAGRGVAA